MLYTTAINPAIIEQWVQKNSSIETVEAELREKKLDATLIAAYIAAFKKHRNANRQFKGFVCMGTGAFLGFVSCVLTLTNPFPEIYNWILYGLTSIAISIILIGLYFVFEE